MNTISRESFVSLNIFSQRNVLKALILRSCVKFLCTNTVNNPMVFEDHDRRKIWVTVKFAPPARFCMFAPQSCEKQIAPCCKMAGVREKRENSLWNFCELNLGYFSGSQSLLLFKINNISNQWSVLFIKYKFTRILDRVFPATKFNADERSQISETKFKPVPSFVFITGCYRYVVWT